MTSTDELEKPAWGVWVDYKIAPPGSYACLVSRFMDNRWTDPEPQWMPAQLRPQLHGEVRVMPYLMPNDPLAAVNALPELVAKVKRYESMIRVLLENEPDDAVSDGGHTVLDLWRHEARAALNQEGGHE